MQPNKSAVIEALHVAAAHALETAEQAQAIAQSEATSPESKAEGKYDTRATEASYLARGQAEGLARGQAQGLAEGQAEGLALEQG